MGSRARASDALRALTITVNHVRSRRFALRLVYSVPRFCNERLAMKLYELTGAPNPRRVRIFLAEKDHRAARAGRPAQRRTQVARVPEEESERQNSGARTRRRQLHRGVGCDCRYFEALQPKPSLFGATPYEIGHIDMANRQLEFELSGPLGTAWVNGPIVAKMAPGRFKQNCRRKKPAKQRFEISMTVSIANSRRAAIWQTTLTRSPTLPRCV